MLALISWVIFGGREEPGGYLINPILHHIALGSKSHLSKVTVSFFASLDKISLLRTPKLPRSVRCESIRIVNQRDRKVRFVTGKSDLACVGNVGLEI